ncbi:MAG: hypothetical protein SPE30_06615 [Candidatus Treponema excrementipullorum]|nr:hypothetical protein [Spirochaetia bacterium]MDD7012086.1 hypothetical protein [Candidatus Treponema excrementipullorum]MCI6952982.1 hypothetical protein [Spirochaetia bacterium]MDY2756813.1 hypothetical protein [Candidatus Treponema excrementipullorum]MDY4465942.1 hypothetical protein [Candidatus Treponema excrementipullorum]
MKKIITVFCILLLTGGFFFAQTTDEPATTDESVTVSPETETETAPAENTPEQEVVPEDNTDTEASQEPSDFQEDFVYKMNQKGDQFINISLRLNVPLKPAPTQLYVGGAGTIGYTRFINSVFALGGDISFAYSTTVGKNVFTYVPILFKVMYQPTVHQFEFPLTLGLGFAFENYNTDTYFGFVAKPEVGAFYRFSPSWSFGLSTGITLMPQVAKQDFYMGVIFDTALTVRYHF